MNVITCNENILKIDDDGNYYRVRFEEDNCCGCSPRDWDNFGHMFCWHRHYNLGDKHDFRDPEDFWKHYLREYVDDDKIIEFALAAEGSAKLERVTDEDGEVSFELYYWGYVSVLGSGRKPAWCYDQRYDTDNIEDLKDNGWYAVDDIVECLSISDCEKLIGDNMICLPLYLYDHSGITMSTGSFNDPWDSGQVGWIFCTKEDIKREYGEVTEETIKRAIECLEAEVKVYDQYLTGDVYWFKVDKFLGGSIGDTPVKPDEVLDDDTFWEETDSCGGFYGYDYDENGMKDYLDYLKDVS